MRLEAVGLRFPDPRRPRTLKHRLARLTRRTEVDDLWVLRDVTITVEPGETFGLIGPNGAGKTSLLRVIAGIFPPDEGQVRTRGSVATALSLTAGLQSRLTGRENVRLLGLLLGLPADEVDRLLPRITTFSGLGDFIDAPLRTYSQGMAARLGFSVICHLERDIILIDEILGVGDRAFREKARRRLEELVGQRTTILVSHELDRIAELCDRVAWLDGGRVERVGPAAEVVAAYRDA